MRWVDQLVRCDDTGATVTACPHEAAWSVHDGRVLETALVECLAQAVAAAAGHRARQRDPASQEGPAAGMLVAVSGFRVLQRPRADETLRIEVRELRRLGPMLQVAGTIYRGDQEIAAGELTLHV